MNETLCLSHKFNTSFVQYLVFNGVASPNTDHGDTLVDV